MKFKPLERQVWSRRNLLSTGLGSISLFSYGAWSSEPTRMISVRSPEFGALGDGQSDDSRAFNNWIDYIEQNDVWGFVPAGRYRVPNLRRKTVNNRLDIFGEGSENTKLIGGRQMDSDWLCLNAPLRLEGISFQAFGNVILVCDGPTPQYDQNGLERFPAVLTRDLSDIEVVDCGFHRCRRPLLALLSEAYSLAKIKFERNQIVNAWSGVYLDAPKMRDIVVADNVFTEIDGSAAGRTRNGNPIRAASSRAIHVGHDSSIWQHWSGGHLIVRNKIRDVYDAREQGPQEDPEVSGINVMGCVGFSILDNLIENVSSAGRTDCEGLYSKAMRGRIENNVFRNAGGREATLALKGRVREAERLSAFGGEHVVSNNKFYSEKADASAALIAVPHVTFSRNHIEGYKRRNPSYGIVTVSTSGPFEDLKITDNTILNSVCRSAIVVRSPGSRYDVSRNRIENLRFYEGGVQNHVSGIRIHNRNSDNGTVEDVTVRENRILKISGPENKSVFAVQIQSDGSAIRNLTFEPSLPVNEFDDVVYLSGPCHAFYATWVDSRGSAHAITAIRTRKEQLNYHVELPDFSLNPQDTLDLELGDSEVQTVNVNVRQPSVRIMGLKSTLLSRRAGLQIVSLKNESKFQIALSDSKWYVA